MKLHQKYQNVIETLKKGHRHLSALSAQEIAWIEENFSKLKTDEEFEQIFCILENTQTKNTKLGHLITQFLERENLTTTTIIFALNASRRQMIEAHHMAGRRLSPEYLSVLERYLRHKDPEVIEWTLRVIDECGSQAIIFKKVFPHIKPSVFKLYNKKYRTVLELITFLERKWQV